MRHLGFTVVIMLGIGVAESSGWLNGLIHKVVKITPAQLVTPMVVFIGVMTNVAENAGYVVFIPLAAMIFKAYKKHPLAGVAAGFAGVSGGFSANLLIGFCGCHSVRIFHGSSPDPGSGLQCDASVQLVFYDCFHDFDHNCGNPDH